MRNACVENEAWRIVLLSYVSIFGSLEWCTEIELTKQCMLMS